MTRSGSRESLKAIFTGISYRVTAASSAREARKPAG
jgi:hypothetical protein